MIKAKSHNQANGRSVFCHTPLDCGKDSIRLIRVSPELSTDGLIECNIYLVQLSPGAADGAIDTSKTLPTPYICLSYTWGSSNNDGAILINGNVFMVRQNLHAFLHVARIQLYYGFLWIDALCIDQANSAERDHQVQRMGTIFAKAKMVIAWLGGEPELERPLHLLGLGDITTQWLACKKFYQREHYKCSVQDYVSLASKSSKDPNPVGRLQEEEIFTFYVALADHEYWRRAWVTQEIMLAKAIYVVAGNAILDYPSLVTVTRCCTHVYPRSHFEHFARLMLVQKDYFSRKDIATGRILISDSWMNNWGLVNLLHYFEDKCCTMRRDMVYSILSLSREAEALRVNYKSPASEVMWHIMSICKDSLCLCTLAVVVRALGQELFAGTQPRLQISSPSVEVSIQGLTLRNGGPVAMCPFCESPLEFTGRSGIEVMFCLLTACKDAEGHIYKELNYDSNGSKYLLTVDSSIERATQILGEVGEGIEIIQDGANNIFRLRLPWFPLLQMVGGPQWGHTLRQQSCGNLWPDKDTPEMERLSVCTVQLPGVFYHKWQFESC